MKSDNLIQSRRQFLQSLFFAAVAFKTTGAFAEDRVLTPRQTEGPFYPNKLPMDTDNDLLVMNDTTTHAAGEVTHLTGRVLTFRGEPVRNAVVEIWHVDNNGIYLHTRSPKRDQYDKNFQGFGRFLTGASGEYYFRTIKPVPYSLGITRTPHIHIIVKKGERRLLTTQMYIKGHPLNERDILFRRVQGKEKREAVLMDFKPVKGSKTGELEARFDIVIGTIPEDLSEDTQQNRDGIPAGDSRDHGN